MDQLLLKINERSLGNQSSILFQLLISRVCSCEPTVTVILEEILHVSFMPASDESKKMHFIFSRHGKLLSFEARFKKIKRAK